MESVEGLSMRKQLRACRGRQKRNNHIGVNCLHNDISEKYQEIYFVESILCERIVKGQKYYKVRWQGFSPEADSWEPEENLSNVLDIIEDFHNKTKNSNLKDLESRKDFVVGDNSLVPVSSDSENFTLSVNCVQSAGEERRVNSFLKRKFCAKTRIGGRFEYVPKHELVASKTKYFDDVRDGKIDLSSNDLYSRVKTRRRCVTETASNSTSNESTNSRNSSLHGEVEQDCDNSMESCTQYFLKPELSSPSSGCFDTSDSSKDSNCTSELDSFRNSDIANKDSINDAHVDLKSDLLYALDTVANLKQTIEETVSDEMIKNSKLTQTNHHKVESASSESSNLTTVFKDVALSPIVNYNNNDEAIQHNIEDSSYQLNIPSSGSTVSSVRQLVNFYFNFVSSCWSTHTEMSPTDSAPLMSNDKTKSSLISLNDGLDNLPVLCPFKPSAQFLNDEELLDAICNQRWSLLACTPTSTSHFHSSAQTFAKPELRNFAQQALLACIKNGAGKPLALLHRLIQFAGLDLDRAIDPHTQWPIMVLTVRLGHHHVAQALLDAGCCPNSIEPGTKQRSILGLAITLGDVDMVNILILAGANFYEVERGVTALSFIIRLLNGQSSNPCSASKSSSSKDHGGGSLGSQSLFISGTTNSSSSSVPTNSKSFSIALVEFQDKLRSSDSQYPPLPCPFPLSPINGSSMISHTLPKPVIYNALMDNYVYSDCINSHANNSTNTHPCQTKANNLPTDRDPTQVASIQSASISLPPSVDGLRRIYELIAAHHARLSMAVSNLVRNWLVKANLVQVGLISPCQWININQHQKTICFHWPLGWDKTKTESNSNNNDVFPLVVLVHGQLTLPACYTLWMDDDGPCFIKQVCLDDMHMQKPLNRMPFVTTLHPLDAPNSTPKEHHVSIEFLKNKSNYLPLGLRPVCVATMIIAVQLGDRKPV